MSEPGTIALFKLTPMTWDVTDSWQFFAPDGTPHTNDLTERKWVFECDHPSDEECDLDNSASCGTPIGYRLVQEFVGSNGG